MRAASLIACSTSRMRPEPGASGTPALQRKLARFVLQAEGAHLLGPWADEDDAGLLAGSAKSGFSDRNP